MTSAYPPSLKRDSTRSLCDQFTTIFDPADSIASCHAHSVEEVQHALPLPFESDNLMQLRTLVKSTAALVSADELLSSASLETILSSDSSSSPLPGPAVVSSRIGEYGHSSVSSSLATSSRAHPSPASTLFTPAATPCSETDESLDTLSPPLSPWFPAMVELEIDSAVADRQVQIANNNNVLHHSHHRSSKSSAACGLDFFNNSFYQSLPELSYRPHPYHHRQRTSSIAFAVRGPKAKSMATEISRTAAPSELYNVTIDEILSGDPLNFSLKDQGLLSTYDFDLDLDAVLSDAPTDCSSDVESNAPQTNTTIDTMPAYIPETRSSQCNEPEDSQQSAMDDGQDDSDYEEPAKRRRVTTVSTGKACKARNRSTKIKSIPRKKEPVQKVYKIYPQRRSKKQAADKEEEECDVSQSPMASMSVSNKGDSRVDTSKTSTAIGLPIAEGYYVCEFCPEERFGRVHDLKRHQMSKHAERTWPCDFCHRPFVRRDALLRHYAVKAERSDGIHPSTEETHRLSEARARARLMT
ncbi:hypothetical protein BG011_005232 [Mortierella polycephala]|uniref:C2H2-type domain-containing protein n=1 Tax=Mortierella polycephala TaxID=41804 RepID=A0A9P6U180_9FUNG|nr:hypothetical protein BG011_005232 [Mortierella polycephala]